MLTSIDVNVLQGREPHYSAHCGESRALFSKKETGLGLGETCILTPPSSEAAMSHQDSPLNPSACILGCK